mgnify:CR=1 FL=1
MPDLKARVRTVRDLFSECFTLGVYQRDYEWEPLQALQLLDDLRQAFERREGGSVDYFIGPIVTRQDPKGRVLSLVDGQQRLTTLAIIVAAIRYAVRHPQVFAKASDPSVEDEPAIDPAWKRVKLKDPAFASARLVGEGFPELFADAGRIALMQSLSESGVDPGEIRRQAEGGAATTTDLRIKQVFQRVVERLVEAFDFVALPLFLRWLADRVVTVEVCAGKDQSEFVIFDRMNARGMPLQPMNLLYNYVNSASANLPDDKKAELIAKMKAVAEEIRKEGGREDIAFFKAFVLARTLDVPQTRQIAAAARDAIKRLPIETISDAPVSYALSNEAVRQRLHLHDPVEFTEHHWSVFGREYARARRAYRIFDADLESLWFVSQTGLEAELDLLDEVLLLSACRPGSDNNGPRLRVAAQFLENLAARLAWYKLTTRTRSQDHRFTIKHMVLRAASAIRDVRDPAAIAQKLAEIQSDITLDFENEPMLSPSKAVYMRMLLARLTANVDNWLPENVRGQRYLSGSWFANYTQTKGAQRFDIEHMLPKPFRVGKSANQAYPEGHNFRSPQTYSERRQSIGALLLLTIDANRSLGDLPYREKAIRYRNLNTNGLITTLSGNGGLATSTRQHLNQIGAEFPDATVLSAEVIEKRVSALRKVAKDLWSPEAIVRAAS